MTTYQGARHWLAFAASGGIAFAIDAVVLKSLTLFAGFSPFSARLIAIAAAMLGGWLAHRTWTFRVAAKPSLAEFGRYAAVASGSAAVNYVIFAGLLLAKPDLEPLIALVLASAVAMAVAYLGMRFGVFGRRDKDIRP